MARHKITSGKKKVSGKKTHRAPRRRRVSGGGKVQTVVMNAFAAGGGMVVAREGSILAGHFWPQLQANPVIVGAVQMVGGVLLAVKTNGLLSYGGLGVAGNGLVTVLNGAGVIGAGPTTMSYDFVNRRRMGDPRLQFVAGPTTRIGASNYPNNFSLVAGPGRKPVRRYTS